MARIAVRGQHVIVGMCESSPLFFRAKIEQRQARTAWMSCNRPAFGDGADLMSIPSSCSFLVLSRWEQTTTNVIGTRC